MFKHFKKLEDKSQEIVSERVEVKDVVCENEEKDCPENGVVGYKPDEEKAGEGGKSKEGSSESGKSEEGRDEGGKSEEGSSEGGKSKEGRDENGTKRNEKNEEKSIKDGEEREVSRKKNKGKTRIPQTKEMKKETDIGNDCTENVVSIETNGLEEMSEGIVTNSGKRGFKEIICNKETDERHFLDSLSKKLVNFKNFHKCLKQIYSTFN